jgi:tetratricopeptide (TPR) repeat protein
MSENTFEDMALGTWVEEWLNIVTPHAKQHFRAVPQTSARPFNETILQETVYRGDRRKNLEQGIASMHQVLSALQKETQPTQWALAQLYLGVAYNARMVGDRPVNQEQAITHCNASLSVFTRTAFPRQWATVQNSLGEIYRNRIRGMRHANLQRAIYHCQKALQVRTRETFPIEWAFTRATSGAVYCELGLSIGEQHDICEKALEHYQCATQILVEENFPVQWAIVQQGLSAAYFMRVSGKKVENIQEAIARGQSALRILTRTSYPFEWAGAHAYLGEAYRQATFDANLQELYSGRSVMQEQAIRHLEAALQVYTHHDYPLEWARVQRFLGMVFRERVQGKRNANLAQARTCFAQAKLSIHS